MKKSIRLISLLLSVVVVSSVVACAASPASFVSGDIEAIYEFGDRLLPGDIVYIDTALDTIPLSANPTGFTIPVPSASGVRHATNQRAAIDFSNARDGYVMARVTSNARTQIRVTVVGPGGVLYQYRLNGTGAWEVFPLSAGNGSYTVRVLEQVQGNRFSVLNTANFSVTLASEFAPFIRPNQFVNFNRDSAVTAKAAELVDGVTGLHPRVEAIYNFVIENISYDRVFAREVQRGMHSGYVPDVDAVLESRRGICFDYASLMAAMLRSIGIPTRLVIGYAGDQFHAWIDVHSETEGWINNVIRFDGRSWNLMDPTFAATGNQSAEVMRFIGDGTNYSPRFRR